jgi:phosphoenolpyruvate carboxykinase (ATP)
MSHKPSVYAELLSEKMREHKANCVLLNTGWTGGSATGGGKRISIAHTRSLLNAALRGDLHNGIEYETHPIFQLQMPKSCPGVPAEILNPRNTWQDKDAYDKQAKKVRDLFQQNFESKHFGDLGIEPRM